MYNFVSIFDRKMFKINFKINKINYLGLQIKKLDENKH